jgi:hypothetical protein
LKDVNPALAHQIALHRNTRGRFNSRHLKRLHDISKLAGFCGIIAPGVSINTSLGDSASTPNVRIPSRLLTDHTSLNNRAFVVDPDTQDDLDGEEEEEELVEEASRSLQDVLRIADDFSQLQLHDNTDEEA